MARNRSTSEGAETWKFYRPGLEEQDADACVMSTTDPNGGWENRDETGTYWYAALLNVFPDTVISHHRRTPVDAEHPQILSTIISRADDIPDVTFCLRQYQSTKHDGTPEDLKRCYRDFESRLYQFYLDNLDQTEMGVHGAFVVGHTIWFLDYVDHDHCGHYHVGGKCALHLPEDQELIKHNFNQIKQRIRLEKQRQRVEVIVQGGNLPPPDPDDWLLRRGPAHFDA
ncbi:hypothetical protein BO70DRAFT_399049 [Aspergillus heteromorphus CBS 117.55]|uniref:Uncharacterized protein n=1 Tax=Aspergillus heteromorphus CBS 117.55 TaxID=1448321 RepID=A0A317VF28_9EURO|nr:uncharacterized protein BO70DRAFT_399049 [Aspergillus heteromorphus CBS 117.55]PWY72976.1 hypothetical protein BO70DRAFT_399049 [Aspergillus heteromorphus CBS 117.55]